jgi:glucose/arabinose dehydrogenase
VIDLSGRANGFAGFRRWGAGLLSAAGAIVALASAVSAVSAAPAGAVTLPPGFQDQTVLSGLNDPTSIAFNQDGSKVFVALKGGQIEEFDGIGDSTPTDVADLRTEVYNHFDRGLLGLALDPDYPSRPYLYALYSLDALPGGSPPEWGQAGQTGDPCVDSSGGDCLVTGRLARLTLDPNTSVEISKQNLISQDWCDESSTHSIGDLEFGPDGALYVSGGDGAHYSTIDWGQFGNPPNPCGDPPGGVGADLEPPTAEGGSLRAQDIETGGDPAGLDGSILRVDPDTGAAMPGNPYIASTDPNKQRIVAYGLRNPFRFTMRPGTNELWTGDVGRNDWEEIDRLTNPIDSTADNFGWPCYEGVGVQPGFFDAQLNICNALYSKGTAIPPYFTYNHADHVVSGEGCDTGSSSVTGVAFNPAGTYPSAYDGALFFGDYSRSCIWAMLAGTGGAPNPNDIVVLDQGTPGVSPGPIDLKIGPDGDLYYVDLNDGEIHRITYSVGNQPPHAVATATPSNSHTAGFTSQLSATGSTDPDGDPLTYAWDLDEDGQFDDATGAETSDFYSTTGVKRPAVQVDDGHGHTSVATVNVQVGNTPPDATITAPTSDLQWATGDTIDFSGTATDAEQTLTDANYSWRIVLHHCPSNCHTHGSGEVDGADSGSFTAPDHDYPAYLSVQLTVTDDGGLSGTEPLSDTESVNIYPSTSQLTLRSTPPGIQLGLDGAVDPSPFTSQVIENSHHTVTAPTSAKVLGIDYAFTSWSDGGAPAHTFVTSGDRTLVAGYHPVAPSPVPTEPSSSPPPAPTKKKKCRKHSKKSAAAAKAKCKKKKKH